MKLIWRFIFGKPERKKEPKKGKREKRSLTEILATVLVGVVLTALELKWSEDLWKPDF